MALNEKEQQILQRLKSLQFVGNEAVTGERDNTIIVIILLAGKYNKFDEVINIINSNQGKSFNEISQLILRSGMFSPVKIVDDDELEESGNDD